MESFDSETDSGSEAEPALRRGAIQGEQILEMAKRTRARLPSEVRALALSE